ncbi:MAG TPA: T9SS type A sorting domain-containing protein [Flavipsychrobacter sp.]|nr:T9SS type A sorting domain-containing protein [Flavipsychrobacter sp.]
MKKKAVLTIMLIAMACLGSFAQTISAYEYWFDDDFAGRTSVNVSGTAAFNINANINITSLSQGYHMLYLRTRSSDGKWSVPTANSFVNGYNPIVGVEYWYDNNYTTKNYVALPASYGGAYSQQLLVSGLSIGNHDISICYVDSIGTRSVPFTTSFYYDGSTGVNDIASASGITLFPNPAKTELRLVNIKSYETLTITDLSGKIILQKSIDANDEVLNIQPLLPGVYNITAGNKKGSITHKFIKID